MKSDWIMQCLKYPKEALERPSKFSALSYCKPIKCRLWSLVVMRLTDFEWMCGPIIFSHHAMKQLHWFHSNLTIQSHSSNISGTLSLSAINSWGPKHLLFYFCCKFVAWNYWQLRASLLFSLISLLSNVLDSWSPKITAQLLH